MTKKSNNKRITFIGNENIIASLELLKKGSKNLDRHIYDLIFKLFFQKASELNLLHIYIEPEALKLYNQGLEPIEIVKKLTKNELPLQTEINDKTSGIKEEKNEKTPESDSGHQNFLRKAINKNARKNNEF